MGWTEHLWSQKCKNKNNSQNTLNRFSEVLRGNRFLWRGTKFTSFIFLHNPFVFRVFVFCFSVRVGSPLLFRIDSITIMVESAKLLNKNYISELWQLLSDIITKSVNSSFVNILFYRCLFFSEAVLQGMSENNQTKKQIDAEIQG